MPTIEELYALAESQQQAQRAQFGQQLRGTLDIGGYAIPGMEPMESVLAQERQRLIRAPQREELLKSAPADPIARLFYVAENENPPSAEGMSDQQFRFAEHLQNTPAAIRPVYAGAAAGGARLEALANRALTQNGLAAQNLEAAGDINVAAESLNPGAVPHFVRGATQSIGTMALGAPLGPFGMIGVAAADASNEAYEEGKKAGLTGAKLASHVATQGIIEGGIAAAFQKFAPGFEGMFGAPVSQGFKAGLKAAGKATLQELPEELVTAELQQHFSKLHDVDKSQWTWEQFFDVGKEAAGQTVAMMGMASAPKIAVSAFTKNPSRANFDALPPEIQQQFDGRSKRSRDRAAEQLAAQEAQPEAVATEAEPVEQTPPAVETPPPSDPPWFTEDTPDEMASGDTQEIGSTPRSVGLESKPDRNWYAKRRKELEGVPPDELQRLREENAAWLADRAESVHQPSPVDQRRMQAEQVLIDRLLQSQEAQAAPVEPPEPEITTREDSDIPPDDYDAPQQAAPEEPSTGLAPIEQVGENYRRPLSDFTPKLYRETNIERALELLPGTTVGTDLTGERIHFANSPNLALGQGDNQGVLLEFDAQGLEGQVSRNKPGWDVAFQGGDAEFTTSHHGQSDYQKSLRSITVRKSAKARGPQRAMLNRTLKGLEAAGWGKVENEDGSTTYSRPAPDGPSVPQDASAPEATVEPQVEPETPHVNDSDRRSALRTWAKKDKYISVPFWAWDYGSDAYVVNVGADKGTRLLFRAALSNALGRDVDAWREGWKLTHAEADSLGLRVDRHTEGQPLSSYLRKDRGGQAAKQAGAEPQVEPETRERHPWEMRRDDLADAVNAHDRPTLERARPLLAAMFPEYTAEHDPWGIWRAIERGDELPRVPMVDFTSRHRSAVETALREGLPVPPSVLADYPDLQPKPVEKGEASNYKIGDKTWFKGDELTITTAPYEKFGGMWQDGVNSAGRTVTIATPQARSKSAESHRQDWDEQQEQFKRLAKKEQPTESPELTLKREAKPVKPKPFSPEPLKGKQTGFFPGGTGGKVGQQSLPGAPELVGQDWEDTTPDEDTGHDPDIGSKPRPHSISEVVWDAAQAYGLAPPKNRLQ